MDKTFNFKQAEKEINAKWLDGEMFRARVNPDKKPYTIIMPPPNITSRLHIGHAFTSTIQDMLIRFKRMQGYEALLLPGADHAAIATEAKVVDELRKQGIEKSSLTREQFMTHIQKWYDYYTPQITEQFKRMGISADWSKFAFTMDEGTTVAVKRVFKNLYEGGLIYRGERMINWCPYCKTALSDAEVEFEPNNGHIWEIKYPLAEDGVNGIVVATTRPETIFGDSAVAVNPNDKRYKNLIGKKVSIPLVNRSISVIADDYVDMKFGTGALKITPAHDLADNQIGTKHGLAAIKIFDDSGKLTGESTGKYAGLDRFEARTKVIEDLKKEGLLISTKPYSNNIGKCYRCHNISEPAISKQWFVKMEKLAEPCIKALNNGLVVTPKKYEKIYLHWLKNIKDWCISRQLLSGHRIPAFYCDKCSSCVISETTPSQCTCGGKLVQDADVLDTWFSSALWPFCTLGWPEGTPEFNYFYPTQTLVSAYDILFFWIIRMVFSGIEQTGKLPFSTALFHGLVRDDKGRKMSKSLGNGIDPIDIIEQFGTDALRFSLICGTKLDRDPRYGLEKATQARNFINKIWNATKYFLALRESSSGDLQFTTYDGQLKEKLSTADKWILTKLNNIIKNISKKYEKFDFGVAANDLQAFFWNDVCDWYLEACKSSTDKNIKTQVLGYVLTAFLKLIAPIMPFIAEQIYCNELHCGPTLLFEPFPTENKAHNFPKDKKYFDSIMELVGLLRAAKNENDDLQNVIIEGLAAEHAMVIAKLCGVQIEAGKCTKADIVTAIAKVELKVDSAAAAAKLATQIAHLEGEIERSAKMLSNVGFVAKAPKELVAAEKQKLAENQRILSNLIKE